MDAIYSMHAFLYAYFGKCNAVVDNLGISLFVGLDRKKSYTVHCITYCTNYRNSKSAICYSKHLELSGCLQ